MNIRIIVVFVLFLLFNCENNTSQTQKVLGEEIKEAQVELQVGAAQFEQYLPTLKQGRGALMVNHTSMIEEVHLVDTLQSLGISIKTIFAPEHGFRGLADAGQKIEDGIDEKSGLPVVSLYGKKKKPGREELEGLDWVIFDIQDVGARFYTYISSMHYLMQACAEFNLPLLILDRPNPNGHYVDGPVLKPGFESFVGMHKIPVVHGMTVGEIAQMINEEGWLGENLRVDLKVIPCKGYTHDTAYVLPKKPSPNLPNNRAIYLYPSLCYFEGTVMSIGRGTTKQFQIIGHPDYPQGTFEFTPISRPGAKYPKHQNKLCRGYDLTTLDENNIRAKAKVDISYLIEAYQNFPDKSSFFLKNNFIDKLAGGDDLRKQIIAGKTEEEIRASWQENLDQFKLIRSKYLIYD